MQRIIGLDYSHNNIITLEASSYSDFTNFLFTSGYKLGKIQAGFESLKKLEQYDMILLSTPRNTQLKEKEIDVLEQYVKNGGNLLIVTSGGSDQINSTNLNELTSKFGFEFEKDQINDSMNYVKLQKRPLLTKFTPHFITELIKKIVYSSACSIKVLDFIEEDKDIKIESIVNAGLNCWRKKFNPEKDDWVQEDSPKIPLMVAVEYYEGRIVGFGSLSMFSSLGREYGFSAFDNDVIIANIFRYLTSRSISEGKVININLNLELFYWLNGLLHESDGDWETISDIINLSVKYFKDNYKTIIEHIKKIRQEKLAKKKKYEETKKKSEDKILEMVPVERKKEDLEDIMSALQEITGEKYELSIDLDEGEKKEPEEDTREIEDHQEENEEKVEIKKKNIESEEAPEVVGHKTEREKIQERMKKEEKHEKVVDMDKELQIEGSSEKEKIQKQIKEQEIKEQERLERILGKSITNISSKLKVEGSETEKEKIQKRMSDEYKKERERLEDILQKEMDHELELILNQVKGEVENQFDSKIEKEKSEKLEKEVEKSIGKDVDKIKAGILEQAKEKLAKESVEIFERVKREIEQGAEGIDLEQIIEKVKKQMAERSESILNDTKEKMKADRETRVKTIKEREIEIIKENQEFLDGILEAAEMFEVPSLDIDKDSSKDKEEED